MTRKLSFEKACAQFVHRYTMDHVPAWALKHPDAQRNGDPVRPGWYAPQFASDREWYENTKFKGEPGYLGVAGDCYTSGQTWPLGQWLHEPFKKVS